MALGLAIAKPPCLNLMGLRGPLKIIESQCMHRAGVISHGREVTAQRWHNVNVIHGSRVKLQDKVLKSWEMVEFYQ